MSVPKISVSETPATAQGFGAIRVLKAGLASVAAAVAANLLVRLLLSQVAAQNPGFEPYGWGAIAILTAAGTFLGVLVFLVISRFVKNPTRVYTVVAILVLALSTMPNLALMANPEAMAFPIGDPGRAVDFGVLVLFHLVAGIVHLVVFRKLLGR